jgi:hypothetical protein
MPRRLLPLLGSTDALRRFEDRVLTAQRQAPRWYKGNTHTHTLNTGSTRAFW